MSKLASLILGTIWLFCPIIANAYVGPGAGISAIGSFVALIAAVLVAILGFVWYPVKRMLKKRNEPTLDDAEESIEDQAIAQKTNSDSIEK